MSFHAAKGLQFESYSKGTLVLLLSRLMVEQGDEDGTCLWLVCQRLVGRAANALLANLAPDLAVPNTQTALHLHALVHLLQVYLA